MFSRAGAHSTQSTGQPRYSTMVFSRAGAHSTQRTGQSRYSIYILYFSILLFFHVVFFSLYLTRVISSPFFVFFRTIFVSFLSYLYLNEVLV